MNQIKIAHLSDLHYSTKTLEEVDRCTRHAVKTAIEERCECAVISGDLFDHRIELHAQAVAAILWRVAELADAMPVLILQGTFSHDTPGSLDVFRTLRGRHPVFVADEICQVALICIGESFGWVQTNEAVIDSSKHEPAKAVFSCLPPVNKATVAAQFGAESAAMETGQAIADLLRGWSATHLKCRENDIPSIIVTHGTVHGSTNEQGVPMMGLDHEFTTETLFAAEASAVMLGHIHQHQTWEKDGHTIAYAGSIGRLHFGEKTPKGFLIWLAGSGSASCAINETPAKNLLEFAYDGAPDLEELAAAAARLAQNSHVRVRYQIDEEHRHSVDRAGIEKLFADAGAREVKIEGRIIPVQRSRTEGINQMTSLADRLKVWCEVTETADEPLVERLLDIQSKDPEVLISEIVEGIS